MSLVFTVSESVFAQDADTLDVAQGFETLNLAVERDTTATGEPKNLNRVYRLERGGYYLLNGAVIGLTGVPLRIVAAKGEGPMPILIPAADETGASKPVFKPRGDGTFIGLYVTGIDNLGNEPYPPDMFTCDGTGARIIIDNCFLDHTGRTFVRENAPEQKLYVTNTIMRNSMQLADPTNGRLIDTRGNTQDTIFVQNCTFYMLSEKVLSDRGSTIKNIIWDHTTAYQVGGMGNKQGYVMGTLKAINVKFTNNLFIDFGFEGDRKPSGPPNAVLADSIEVSLFPINALNYPDAPDPVIEKQRNILVKNNVYGWTPELLAWINSIDTVVTWVFHDVRTKRFFATYSNMISENNIEEYPVFFDPPDPARLIAYADYRLKSGFTDVGNPDPRADRNGIAPLIDDPASVGPASDEYDFDYKTTSRAYTHAEGVFPVGDLNWFPDKKAEWEVWIKTGVDFGENRAVLSRFSLKQNYPNPFNPATTIIYQLNVPSVVKLTVYNSLGQIIRTLVNDERQEAGDYSVQWGGLDESSRIVASGLYMYRLEADNQVQTKKMLLMK